MSVARTILLKVSDNQWLRANGTKVPFIRRAVTKFMPGEAFDDMLGASRATAQEGIQSVFTRLGENVKDLAEADFVERHYLDAMLAVRDQFPKVEHIVVIGDTTGLNGGQIAQTINQGLRDIDSVASTMGSARAAAGDRPAT